jgi:hypothetical protein
MVPAIGPDGTPINVPETAIPELEAAQGRPITPEQGAYEQHKIDVANEPFDPVDYLAASHHARIRGQAEAFGLSVDEKIADIASLYGGPEGRKKAIDYIKKLEEVYPTTHAINHTLGLVGGAIGGAEMTGGGLSEGMPRTVGGVAARMARGGVENTVQNVASDFNEAALGRADLNSEKIYAAMPKHFAIGSALVGGTELGVYGIEKGIGALAKSGVPALERGASGAIGRDLGLEGAEAVSTGERIRGLNHGEVPRSASEAADLLGAEQEALRGGARMKHASIIDALESSQAEEAGSLSIRQEAARKAALRKGAAGVAEAETGAELARQQGAKRVADVHEEGARSISTAGAGARKLMDDARTGARIAESDAESAGWGGVFGATVERENRVAAAEASLAAERATVERELREIESARKTLASERETANDLAERLGKERAEHAAELERATSHANEITAAETAEMDPAYIRSIIGADAPSALDYFNPMDGRKLAKSLAAMESAESEAARLEVQRLTQLGEQIEAAHRQALGHVTQLDGIGRTLDFQANQRLAYISGVKSSPALDMAEGAIKAAHKEGSLAVAQAQEEAARLIREAKSGGGSSVAEAKRIGESLIADAKSAAKAALEEAQKGVQAETKARNAAVSGAKAGAAKDAEAFEQSATKERKALDAKHKEDAKKIPKLDERTDIDPLVEKARSRASAQGSGLPGSAALGAVISLSHGNVAGAALSALTGLAGSAAKMHGNYIAARVMRGLSKEITSMDNAIRAGAMDMLRGTAPKAANVVDDDRKKKPSFEEVSKRVIEARGNPMVLQNRVNVAVGKWAVTAPMLYASVLTASERAQSFLESVLPQPQKDPYSLTPHLEPSDISDSDKYDFMQYVSAIDDPIAVFRDVKSGTVTDQQIEAVRAVYPNLYMQMQLETKRQLQMLKKPLPYELEINIGRLMEVQTNQVLDPMFQQQLRMSYEQKEEAGGPMKGSRQSSGDAKVGKAYMSESQRVERGE